MSLFGTSPPDTSTTNNSTTKSSNLFEESSTRKAQSSSSGLFETATDDTSDSPWGFQPSPKKQARANVVRNLLPASDVPESYIDTFDSLAEGTTVQFAKVRKLLEGSGVSAQEQERILEIVSPGGAGDSLGRGKFNVLLALIGLAQESEEVSLDSVDDRKRRLPEPHLPSIPKARPATPPHKAPLSTSQTTPDPWGSPTNSRTSGTPHISNMPARTTSTFTTGDEDAAGTTQAPHQTSSGSGGADWTYSSSTTTPFGNENIEEGGFGGAGIDEEDQPAPRASKPHTSRRQISHGAEEEVTVTVLPEKQGPLLFQYRNYEVATARRNSKVVRRYSDFVWLLDCLHKRFPFRQLPLLPPKRVAINGNHIAADTTFIEKRRRGLQRFANAIIRHPVLSQEQLVVMFLTVPTELSVWRKQASITVQEEFIGKPLPPTLEDSLPPTLDDLFDTVRSGVRRSAETYINLCSSLERIIKRREGLGGEYSRLSSLLFSATETNADTYKLDTNDVPLLNEGIASTAKHIETSQNLVVEEAHSWDEGALEDFKRQRDALVSMREMFDRRDRFAKDTIPACEKRIAGNESKLAAVRNKPEGTRKVGEAEKLEDAIMKDKESIVTQHARGIFIRECLRDEIQIFQATQYHISRMHQDWAAERCRYAEQQVECWRVLGGQLESMPGGGE